MPGAAAWHMHVVSERLGHATVSITMEVYAHVMPDMQQAAAPTLGTILHAGAS
jgi:integrase